MNPELIAVLQEIKHAASMAEACTKDGRLKGAVETYIIDIKDLVDRLLEESVYE